MRAAARMHLCECVGGGAGRWMCDWRRARPDVSQLLIREAMKGPPAVKLHGVFQINQEDGDIFEPWKKNK